MRKNLFILLAIAAFAACQAVAAVSVGPDTATWNLEPTTVTASGGTTYNWNINQIWTGFIYNGDVTAVYPQDTVPGTDDWKAGDTLTFKVVKNGNFLKNGSCENRLNDNTKLSLDALNARYDHIDNGGAWKHWLYSTTDPNVNNSFRVSYYLVKPDATGIHHTSTGVARGWKYPGADPIYAAFTDAMVPDGQCYGYAMTYKKDHNNVYNGTPVDGVAQILRNTTFHHSKEITFTVDIGKFPAGLMLYNGYYLQIAVGGSEKFTAQFQQGNGTPFVYEGTVLAETYADPNSGGAELSWHTNSVTYTPDFADRIYDGLPIQVRILVPEIPTAVPGNDGVTIDIAAVAFDDAHVTINGVEGIDVGPVTIQVGTKANTGEIGTANITVADTPCGASAAAGTAPAGDLDGDCDADMADLAILASGWLIDGTPTAPIALP